MLSVEQQNQVREKIRAIEAQALGEILVVLAQQVIPTRWVRYHMGLFMVFVFGCIYFFLREYSGWLWLNSGFWWVQLVTLLGFSFLGYGVGYFLGSWKLTKYLLIPHVMMDAFVRLYSLNFFLGHSVSKTPSRSGILVFISQFEREVAILVDSALHQKMGQDKINLLIQNSVPLFKQKKWFDGINCVLDEIQNILVTHFPKPEKKNNELHEELIILNQIDI